MELNVHYRIHKSPDSCFYPQTEQSMSTHPTSWRPILILSFDVRLYLPSGLFSLRFPYQTPVYTSSIPHNCYMPWVSQSSWFYHPISIWWAVHIITVFVMLPLHCPATSSFLHPNTFLSTLFSNTLIVSAYVPLSMWETNLHIHTKQQEKLQFCIFQNLYSCLQTGRQKILHRMIANIPWLQSALNFFMNGIWYVRVVPKYLNCPTIWKNILPVFKLGFYFRSLKN
jgi:hypothetical protein